MKGERGVAHYRVLDARRRGFVPNLDDIIYPLVVVVQRVRRDANDLDVALQKLRGSIRYYFWSGGSMQRPRC